MRIGALNFCFPRVLIATLLLGANLAKAELVVSQAWVQLAPPGARATAAYLSLSNPTDSPIIIQSLDASCCAHVMLHRTRREGERVLMEHLDEITVPAHGDIKLEPGGLHIMLMGAKAPLKAGDPVSLQLQFADGRRQKISLLVQSHVD